MAVLDLDKIFSEPVTTRLPLDRTRHLYLLGRTGSGKTSLLLKLIEKDITRGRTTVVIDPKGDLVDRILCRCAALPDFQAERLCLIDLRDESSLPGFNPLDGPGDAHARAYHVLSVIKNTSESWGVRLEETLRNALVLLAEQRSTLLSLEPLLTNAAFRSTLVRRSEDPFVRSFFQRFDSLSPDSQSTWTLPVLNKVTPFLAIPRMRRLLGSTQSLDLASLLNTRGSVVLIGLAADRLHDAWMLLGGLFVSMIRQIAMSRAEVPEDQRNPVYLTIDEFEAMASSQFEQIIAEGRRFRLCLTLAHQHLAQLPPKLKAAILANIQRRYYFALGADDAAEIARTLPRCTVDEFSTVLQVLPVGRAIQVEVGFRPVLRSFSANPDPHLNRPRLDELKEASKVRFAAKPTNETTTHNQGGVHHVQRPQIPA